MSKWVQLGPIDESECFTEAKIGKRYIDVRMIYKSGYGEGLEQRLVALTYEEALNFACQLPEIKALLAVVREYSDCIGPLEEQNPNDGGGGYEAATKIRDALKPFEERKDE